MYVISFIKAVRKFLAFISFEIFKNNSRVTWGHLCTKENEKSSRKGQMDNCSIGIFRRVIMRLMSSAVIDH